MLCGLLAASVRLALSVPGPSALALVALLPDRAARVLRCHCARRGEGTGSLGPGRGHTPLTYQIFTSAFWVAASAVGSGDRAGSQEADG